MAEVTDTVLKSYLEAGDVPTQAQFEDLIDSKVNKPDLASTTSGKGASLVTFESGKTVQDLASTTSGKGADLVGVPLTGSAGVTVGDWLGEYPLLNEWVTSGTGTSADPWIVDVTALNTQLAIDGTVIRARNGYYQTDGVVHLSATLGSGLIGTTARSTFIQSTDATEPVIRVSGRHAVLENLTFGFTAALASLTSTAIGLSVHYATDNTAYCTFRNLYINNVYTGIGEESTTGATFNNVYENITVQAFNGWGLYLDDAASGDTFDAIYITNNSTTETAVGLFHLAGDHKATIRQLNLEHAKVSSNRAIKFGTGKISVDGLHIEDITYTHTDPYIISFSGTYSQITVNNLELNSVVTTAAAQTGNVYLFDFYSAEGQFRITGTRLWNDVSLEAGGTLYWADLTNTNADSVDIYIEDFVDLSIGANTAVRYLGPNNGDNATALRWFDDQPWGYTSVRTAVYDFDADGGAISSIALDVLPKNTTITRAWYEVLATPIATTPGSATIAFGVQTNDVAGLLAATADSNAALDVGYHDYLPNGVAANFTTKTTNLRNLIMTIAGDTLTQGKIRIWYEYVTSE